MYKVEYVATGSYGEKIIRPFKRIYRHLDPAKRRAIKAGVAIVRDQSGAVVYNSLFMNPKYNHVPSGGSNESRR